MGKHHLKDGAGDNEAIKAIKWGFEVDSRS